MVFGAVREKDLSEIGKIIFPKAEWLIFTTAANTRSTEAGELLDFLPGGFDKNKVWAIENVEEALKRAKKITSENGLICVTGSLYLVGEAQEILKKQSEI